MAKLRDSSELVYTGKVFSVRRHSLAEPGGLRVIRDIVHHPGAAVMLPLLDDGRILVERQFRLAAGKKLWEIPAGTVDPGETPLQTARRELEEETGYRAKSWRKLLEFYPSPGLLSEKMTLFLASGLRAGAAHPEADEHITVQPFSLPELLAMIEKRTIVDGKTIVGLLYYSRFAPAPSL